MAWHGMASHLSVAVRIDTQNKQSHHAVRSLRKKELNVVPCFGQAGRDIELPRVCACLEERGVLQIMALIVIGLEEDGKGH